MAQKKKMSTQPYRGTKDHFPEDRRLIQWIFDIWHKTSEAFGYEEYAGPFLEPIELYLSKTSEEIVNEQLYHVHDKGERHLAIRPEMTPTLARMVASRVGQLVKPIRLFSIAACMRYERPQKSRLRQFDQFNLDVLGGEPMDEDVEVLLTIVHMLRQLGARGSDYRIKLNHRGVVNDFLAGLSLPKESHVKALRLMDHLPKMSKESFMDSLAELGATEEDCQKIFGFMTGDLALAKSYLDTENPHITYLEKILGRLKEACPMDEEVFVFAPEVMRGFDYYTGVVFEVFDNHPENRRALFGGGRYDDLVGSFGGEPLSGVGYGVSEISLINFMKTHELLPALKKKVDVFVFGLCEKASGPLLSLAMELRSKDLKVEQAMGQRKPAKLFAMADKLGAKVAIFMGEDELSKGVFCVKFLATKEQQEFPLGQLEGFLAKI